MNLLPTTLLLLTVSLVHSQRILEPVSVFINQNGLPAIETYNPDEVKLFEDEDEIVSSNNGYEIDNPCIYAHHWYRIKVGSPEIFDNSDEYDTSLKEFAIFSSAKNVYFTTLYPEIDNYQPFVYFPYFTVGGFAGFSDTTITYEIYPYSFWDGYYQSPPRHEFLDLMYQSPNQIAQIRHGGYFSDTDSTEKKMLFTTWNCDYGKDHFAHVEIILHYDSMQLSSEELPTRYYKKNAYTQYDKKNRLEYILMHKGNVLSSIQKAMYEVEDSLRKVCSQANDFYQSETIRQITDSNNCVTGFMHYIYSGDYLKEVIAFSEDYTGVITCTFEYDKQKRLTKVIHKSNNEISSVLELTYLKRNKRVHSIRQILPINGEYPSTQYVVDVLQKYHYDSKNRVKSIYMTSTSDEVVQWQDYYYGD
ncbi:MAG: hypothetical protein ACKVOK_06835 [Flavobacteriales bacterium]